MTGFFSLIFVYGAPAVSDAVYAVWVYVAGIFAVTCRFLRGVTSRVAEICSRICLEV